MYEDNGKMVIESGAHSACFIANCSDHTSFDERRTFLSKVVQYEGVNNMSIEEWIETFKQKD